jgi:sucrose-6-phosphate hydrolase SacC (GH32 family)
MLPFVKVLAGSKDLSGYADTGVITAFRNAIRSTDVEVLSTAALALRRWMLIHDPHYPKYHFTAPAGWINDPNGPLLYEGRYHLFYQYDPQRVLGTKDPLPYRTCWGHAVSDNLSQWVDWPVALWPDRPQDSRGVWSGNTFIADDGTPCALYTGNATGNRLEQCGILARSRDGMLTWEKRVVMSPSQRPNSDTPVHHDGYVWKEGDTWFQLIGGTTRGDDRQQQGAAWLWSSPDLEHWRLRGNIAPSLKYGQFWELPYLINLDGRQILLVGANNNPCWTGTYEKERMLFTAGTAEPQQVDTGNYYSFNLNMTDRRGPRDTRRQLMHGWVTGPATPTKSVPYWQGAHSIPRVLVLKDGKVWQEPISEIERLRTRHWGLTDLGLTRDVREIRSDALEIRAKFTPGANGKCGVNIRVSPDGKELTQVYFDAGTRTFGVAGPTMARNSKELVDDNGFNVKSGVSQVSGLPVGAPVEMRIFLDRSIVEVFVNGAACTARTFPNADALGMEVFSEPGGPQPVRLDVWEMKSMWA